MAGMSVSEALRTLAVLSASSSPFGLGAARAVAGVLRGGGPLAPAAAWLVRHTAAEVFTGGESAEAALHRAERALPTGAAPLFDHAAEGCAVAPDEALAAAAESLQAAARWRPRGVSGAAVKLSAFGPPSAAPILELGRLADALGGVRLLVDAEEYETLAPSAAAVRVAQAELNRRRAVVSTTYQAYLQGCDGALQADLEAARAGGYVLGVKLVRGAYLEHERRAGSPVHASKEATDACFDACTDVALDAAASGDADVVVATHNSSSIERAIRRMEANGLGPDAPRVSFAQLLGMAGSLTRDLSSRGFRVMTYIPYGELRVVIPFLLRRAQEQADTHVLGRCREERAAIVAELYKRSLGG